MSGADVPSCLAEFAGLPSCCADWSSCLVAAVVAAAGLPLCLLGIVAPCLVGTSWNDHIDALGWQLGQRFMYTVKLTY